MRYLHSNHETTPGWIVLAAACLLLTMSASAQESLPAPDGKNEFEVAAIKPHPEGDYSSFIGGAPGRYEASNVTAKFLVEQAFDVPADQVSGGPQWVESQRFDVNARIGDERWQEISKLHSSEQNQAVQLMVQSLLRERFHLAISHRPKELTVYALVVARGGLKLRPTGTPGPQEPTSGSFVMGMTQNDAPVSALARFLQMHFGRTVLDKTGASGLYDLSFYVPTPDENSAEAADSAIFQALEDQLGLKLVSRREMVDTIVIDHLEQPSEN